MSDREDLEQERRDNRTDMARAQAAHDRGEPAELPPEDEGAAKCLICGDELIPGVNSDFCTAKCECAFDEAVAGLLATGCIP